MLNPLFRGLWVVVLSSVVQSVLAAAPETFTVSEYTFKRPAAWEWVETTSSMRKAQLKITDAKAKEPGEVVFFHFGPSDGGGVQANVERWYGQFSEGRDKINAKSEEVTIEGTKVTFVRAQGTYLSGMPGGPRKSMPEFALLGAIVQGKEGSVFIKATGPATLIKGADQAFRGMVDSALKKK